MKERSLERNLRLVQLHRILRPYAVSVPIQVLYVESRLGLEAAISLIGI